jgi:O-methyltransferase domain
VVAAGKESLAELVAMEAWRGTETVVDVGGGTGALLQGLLERRAGLRGIVLDLPEAVAGAARDPRPRPPAAGRGGGCAAQPARRQAHGPADAGRERTERQWRALLADGGFQLTGIRPGHSAHIMEAAPR